MPIITSCPNCSTRMQVADTAIGRSVKCPKCAVVIRVPITVSNSGIEKPALGTTTTNPLIEKTKLPAITSCPSCGIQMKVPDNAVGRTFKCPSCAGLIKVPAEIPTSMVERTEPAKQIPSSLNSPISSNYTYRDIGGLTKFLKVLLGLGLVMGIVSLASSLMQAEMLNRGGFTEAEGESNDQRESIIGLIAAGLYLFTAVAFGWWIVRANRNVRALGAVNLPITPGWAVGWFFVPFANLVKPFHAMKDLWRASHNPISWETAGAGTIPPMWWTLWILNNVLGHVSFRIMMNAKKVEEFQMATYFSIFSEIVNIPLCLVAMALVGRIASAQHSYLQKRI